ncbi:MAG: hypothetical protein QOJ13_1666 [Gaiellales bacterium]|jgi:hypothetical protein|nr:hypothetical protein [Gaiellales bacterium]
MTTAEDSDRFFADTAAARVQTVEAAWLDRLCRAELYAYTMPVEPFDVYDEPGGSGSVERWCGLFGASRSAICSLVMWPRGIDLRIVPSLWPLHDAVAGSTVGFSMIRMRNAGR